MSLPLFLIFAALLVAASLGVILFPHPVRSALSLVSALFILAVIYIFLDAHLVAALQIIVYAGAIMVLFLFVIMLLNLQTEVRESKVGLKAAAAIAAGLLAAQLAYIFHQGATGVTDGQVPAAYGTTEAVAERLFSHFLLPFELTSVLLLVAIVGAVVLAKRRIG